MELWTTIKDTLVYLYGYSGVPLGELWSTLKGTLEYLYGYS